jgi:hypothetical protein
MFFYVSINLLIFMPRDPSSLEGFMWGASLARWWDVAWLAPSVEGAYIITGDLPMLFQAIKS